MQKTPTFNEKIVTNIEQLMRNPYPGRGIVMGRNMERMVVQIYWLMGRSENSRNRRFVRDGTIVRTEAVDLSKVTDASLIIYRTMREERNYYAVSNGDQTDDIFQGRDRDAGTFFRAMLGREFEPDKPNYTPRISALCILHGYAVLRAYFASLSRSPFGTCERTFYQYEDLPQGFGYCVHTYAGDGNPLPAFTGKPYLLPLKGTIEDISTYFWNLLNKENRVALATKVINPETNESNVHIINRF